MVGECVFFGAGLGGREGERACAADRSTPVDAFGGARTIVGKEAGVDTHVRVIAVRLVVALRLAARRLEELLPVVLSAHAFGFAERKGRAVFDVSSGCFSTQGARRQAAAWHGTHRSSSEYMSAVPWTRQAPSVVAGGTIVKGTICCSGETTTEDDGDDDDGGDGGDGRRSGWLSKCLFCAW